MAPKASPVSGSKKKKVVKVVRKPVVKPQTPTTATTTSPTAAAAPPVAAAAAAPPVAAAAAPVAASTATSETPASHPTVATAPDATQVPSEAPVTDVAEPEATTEAPEPEAVESAAAETTAPETTAEPSVADPAAATEPAAAEKSATKTVTRVRKVIKKKIVVKRVPKGTLAAKKEEENVVSKPAAGAEAAEVMEVDKGDGAETAAPVTGKGEGMESAAPAAGEGTESAAAAAAAAAATELSEGRKRRKSEIFVGGLGREVKEEDLRKVFEKAGEIAEIRVMMDPKTGKNKGYAFVRYADPSVAKKAIAQFAKVEVCGKTCGAAALEGNDRIFLGNIDKTWKKDDIIKLLQDGGIEKIDTLTIMADASNAKLNRGFAFLELETNRDAQLAYKKLQKKDIFGKDQNVKVAWAEPFNDPDEEEMLKVKSVHVDAIPSSWNETKVRETFKKFGEIERIVLSRNINSAKRKDFAFVNYTTREAALSCVESFDKEELTDNGSKVNLKVSLAKPVKKDKQNKGGSKLSNKDKIKEKQKTVERNPKVDISSNQGKYLQRGHASNGGDKKSTTHELLHVLREQATWKQEQSYARGPVQDYSYSSHGGKRPLSSLGVDAPPTDLRGYPRARLDTSFPVSSSSYAAPSQGLSGGSSYLSYYQQQGAGYAPGPSYGLPEDSNTQRRQGGPPYGGNRYY